MTALLLLAQLMDRLSDYPHCVFSHLCLPRCPPSAQIFVISSPSAQISVISSPSEATVCTTCGYKGSDEDLAEKENPSALDHGSSKSSTEVKDSVSPSFVTHVHYAQNDICSYLPLPPSPPPPPPASTFLLLQQVN